MKAVRLPRLPARRSQRPHPLRAIASALGHPPLGVNPEDIRDATREAFAAALARGKTGTLPGARAMYWADKLRMKGVANRHEARQEKFIVDAAELVQTIADASQRMTQADRGGLDYEQAKRTMERARIKLANRLSKIGEYTHPLEYAGKAYKASLLSAPHIPAFNILAQAFQFPFHEAQKAIDFLVPAKVFNEDGIGGFCDRRQLICFGDAPQRRSPTR